MSVSHFIKIQQKEKESLAAYFHRFKKGSQENVASPTMLPQFTYL